MVNNKDTTTARISTALVISDTILTVVQDAARVSPIPCFQQAAGLALGIIKIAQDVIDNKGAFNRLAADACGLVYILYKDQEEGTVSKGLWDNMQDLLTTLKSIERFAKKQASRGLILRIIMHKSDIGKILEYRDHLRQSLDVFGLKSSISIQDNITCLLARQEDLLRELREREAREKAKEEHERLERERKDRENLERERAEGERLEKEKEIREKIVAESLESQRLALEREVRARLVREQEARDQENTRLEEERREFLEQTQCRPVDAEATYTPPITPPYYPLHSPQQPPSLYKYFRDGAKITTIYGDQTTTSGSTNITNTNSGNTNSNNITGSYNDSSVRVRAGIPGRRGKRRWQ